MSTPSHQTIRLSRGTALALVDELLAMSAPCESEAQLAPSSCSDESATVIRSSMPVTLSRR